MIFAYEAARMMAKEMQDGSKRPVLNTMGYTRQVHESFMRAQPFILPDGLTKGFESAPTQLPPMPFPTMTIELENNAFGSEGNDVVVDIQMFLVDELEEGRIWNVAAFCNIINRGKPVPIVCIPYVIRSDSTGVWMNDEQWPSKRAEYLRVVPVELMHLITARSVTHVPHGTRQTRRNDRRLNEKAGITKALPTTIRIGGYAAYGDGQHDSERSGSHLSCRFLVRGHWRELKQGKRAWVRPYIKGPAGAPWREPINPVRKLTLEDMTNE